MCSTPELENIYSKRMCVDAMTNKEEVIFSKECKRLLDLRDEIGTKGDKKHVKHEDKTRLHSLEKITSSLLVMASTHIRLLSILSNSGVLHILISCQTI